jgi:hypothetical protein
MQDKKNKESIIYVQEIIDRSWEILHQMEEEEKESMIVVEEKEVEEVQMLSDNIKEPLLDLDKCSLHELINIFQIFANDPSFNVHQTGFGSYIANHVSKEKIQHYNNEARIPHKLGDVWIPKVLIVVGKESHHDILDLGSSVNIVCKDLYDLLDLDKKMEKSDIDLLLADDSTKHALGRIDNVMIELHMTFVPVYFIIMDMRSNTSSPKILGRPILRTTSAIIDSKEGNVKFQFPHNKCMENCYRLMAPENKLLAYG